MTGAALTAHMSFKVKVSNALGSRQLLLFSEINSSSLLKCLKGRPSASTSPWEIWWKNLFNCWIFLLTSIDCHEEAPPSTWRVVHESCWLRVDDNSAARSGFSGPQYFDSEGSRRDWEQSYSSPFWCRKNVLVPFSCNHRGGNRRSGPLITMEKQSLCFTGRPAERCSFYSQSVLLSISMNFNMPMTITSCWKTLRPKDMEKALFLIAALSTTSKGKESLLSVTILQLIQLCIVCSYSSKCLNT